MLSCFNTECVAFRKGHKRNCTMNKPVCACRTSKLFPQATTRPVTQGGSKDLLKCLRDEREWVLESYLEEKGVELLEAWNTGYKAAIEAVAKKMNVDLAAL